MTSTAVEVDAYPYTDFASLSYPPQFAATALGISPQTLKNIEAEGSITISRVSRGSVQTRSYSLSDIFQIARMRRDNKLVKGFSRPFVVSNYVPKGGTGKTTTTGNLAVQFSLMGLRTLVIDNDPQADISTMFGYDPDLEPHELSEMGIPLDRGIDGNLGNLLWISNLFKQKTLDEVIKKPFGEYGPHLIPADIGLDDMDTALRSAMNSDLRYSLFIEQARTGKLKHCDLSGYDVIIIDNAPAGDMLSRNAMVAADFLVCPIRMDKFSFRALSRLAQRLNGFVEGFGRSPEIIAIPTMYVRNRPRLERNMGTLMNLFPGKVTESRLYLSDDYQKSLEAGVPLALWRQANENSIAAMRGVFDEMVARIRAVTEGSK
ncbi:TPA: ParA family protein [Burkholderia lata]